MDNKKDTLAIETPRLLIKVREKRRLLTIYGIIAGALLFAGLSQESGYLFFAISTIFILLTVQQYFEVSRIEKEIVRRKDAYAISILYHQRKGRSKENAIGWGLIAVLFFITGFILLPFDTLWTGLSFVILGIATSSLCLYSWLEWHKLTLSSCK